MAVLPINGTVVGHRSWTDKLHSIQIKADVNSFESGQFGRIGLNIDGKNVMRPYSFVNAQGGTRWNFIIVSCRKANYPGVSRVLK